MPRDDDSTDSEGRSPGGPSPFAVPARHRRRQMPPRPPLLWFVVMLAGGALILLIHAEVLGTLHPLLRDWALHFLAVLCTAICTTWLLGLHHATNEARRRLLLCLGCGIPLLVTLLHELGQWLWPAGPRDTFDSLRDAALNIAGAAVAWALLRRPSAGACGPGADGGQLAP